MAGGVGEVVKPRSVYRCVPDARQRRAKDSRYPTISWQLRTSSTLPARRHQSQLAFLRQHQQHVLVREQDELAVAVASALPRWLAVLEVDAREHAAVKAEGMVIVNHEVVEVWLQRGRRPAQPQVPRPAGNPGRGSERRVQALPF
ncbi:MAG TPA: hypothetical protein VNY05_07640 [Candidatus Acidoferrales bacterium]|nr:hypothetical protein [Candidatus Acidoferrales bacterium]